MNHFELNEEDARFFIYTNFKYNIEREITKKVPTEMILHWLKTSKQFNLFENADRLSNEFLKHAPNKPSVQMNKFTHFKDILETQIATTFENNSTINTVINTLTNIKK
jgi:hypothetical protein